MEINTDTIINPLITWGAGRPDVRAMLLTSSLVSRSAPVDQFSDYDVIVVVEDVMPYFSSRDWLEYFGRVLVLYRDPLKGDPGNQSTALITQYENGLKIDFSIWPVAKLQAVAAMPALPPDLELGYRVLLDKDSLTVNMPEPSGVAYIPKPPTREEFLTVVEEMFHEATYVAKHLRRGDLMAAKYNLDHAMKFDNLRRMMEWRAEIAHHWTVKPGAYGRYLHRWIDPADWAALQATYCGPETGANWVALYRTLSLFGQQARIVGAEMGYAYPEDLEQRVLRYLRRVQQLDLEKDAFPWPNS